jgi:glycosyltransferase involved in cell wall biosynthesis
MKPEKLDLTITTWSNSPYQPTGYGMQVGILLDYLVKHGVNAAHQSNWGLEGSNSTYKTAFGEIPHYARGYEPMSQDALAIAHKMQIQKKDYQDYILTLGDVWTLKPEAWPTEEFPRILSWVPLDHISIPPAVKRWLEKDNVTPIAMAPFGAEQLAENGIEGIYIPHSIDTVSTFKPTDKIGKQDAREFLGLQDTDFLVMMNSANKANKSIHRKAFAEALMAFAVFKQKVPNAYLYIHTEPKGIYGGFDLPRLVAACGVPMDAVIFPDAVDYRLGLDAKDLAGFYSTADVALQLSLGGGFEIPIIEAQACGTRVIATDWTGPRDLVAEDGFKVTGQLFWDEAQAAWWKTPSIASIVTQLENSYEVWKAEGRHSETSRKFAQNFDSAKVWNQYWLPFLKGLV